MSLPVLVVLVVFGIALSVAAVHFTGGTTTATLAGADQALARFAEDFPDEKPGAVRLTADSHAAFRSRFAALRHRPEHRRLFSDTHRHAARPSGAGEGRERGVTAGE